MDCVGEIVPNVKLSIGNKSGRNTYRMFVPEDNRLIISSDVIFAPNREGYYRDETKLFNELIMDELEITEVVSGSAHDSCETTDAPLGLNRFFGEELSDLHHSTPVRSEGEGGENLPVPQPRTNRNKLCLK